MSGAAFRPTARQDPTVAHPILDPKIAVCRIERAPEKGGRQGRRADMVAAICCAETLTGQTAVIDF